MGFFALTLKWLTPFQAMFCALIAFAHNLFVFPLYGRKKIEREEERTKKYTAIVSYPFVVFLLIFFSFVANFKNEKMAMAVAAASWAVLAFGDSMAGIAGKIFGGPKVLWNKEKTLAGSFMFTLFSLPLAYSFFNYTLDRQLFKYDDKLLIIAIVSSLSSAIVESLPRQFDDNISFSFVSFSIMTLYSFVDLERIKSNSFIFNLSDGFNFNIFVMLQFVNFVLALTAYFKKWVDKNGFLFGLFLGSVVIATLGIRGYVVLTLFFVVANSSTFYKFKTKEKRGIAEENRGKRGIESVFSKGFAPLIFSFVSFESFSLILIFYAADTIATEFGKATSGKTFSLIGMKEVKSGSSGGVTPMGSLSGIIFIILSVYLSLFEFESMSTNYHNYIFSVLLLFLFFFGESLINDLNSRKEVTTKVAIHLVLGFLLGAFANSILMVTAGV